MLSLSKYIRINGDRAIWSAIGILAVFSLLVVYSSTGNITANPLTFFVKHLVFLVVGFAIIYVFSRQSYAVFFNLAKLGFYLALVALVLLLLFGKSNNQAVRTLWGFQVFEPVKIALILYMAYRITAKQDVIHDFKRGFLSVLWPVILVCSLIFLSNFSTAAILAATCFVMMYVGRAKLSHLLITLAATVLLFVMLMGYTSLVLVNTKGKPKAEQSWFWRKNNDVINRTRLKTVYSRIFTHISDDSGDLRDKKMQAVLSHAAIVHGGLIGVGPGNSQMKYRLPQPFSDFVFAIVVEEYGVLLAIALLALYLIIMYRVGVMVRRSTRFFPAMLAIGIGTQITLQALMHVWVVTGLMPVTGQNLPFISQGGSSLICTCIMFGILLSVSKFVDNEEPKESVEQPQATAVANG